MSYSIFLEEDGYLVDVPRHAEGGTVPVDGTTKASMGVTYNYAPLYRHTLGDRQGLVSLHHQRAGDTILALEHAVAVLGDAPAADYWAATPGNAGHALAVLLGWARLHPNAYWTVEA